MPRENWREYPGPMDRRYRVQEYNNPHRAKPFDRLWDNRGDQHATVQAAIDDAKRRSLATGCKHRVVIEDPMGQQYGLAANSDEVLVKGV